MIAADLAATAPPARVNGRKAAGLEANEANGHRPNGMTSTDAPAIPLTFPLVAQLEAVLFVAARPVTIAELVQALGVERRAVEAALKTFIEGTADRGVKLQRDGNQVQLVSAPEAAPSIERFLGLEATARLSKAALETLSIIAYRQPVTRPEIDDLRGVNSEATLRTLLARELVEPAGERPTVGHPVEYRTTFQFLEYFGLGGVEDLPPLDSVTDGDEAAGDGRAESGTDPVAGDGVEPLASSGGAADALPAPRVALAKRHRAA